MYGEGEKAIKLILLDHRYFNDEATEDMLGAEQWEWLENELKEPAMLYLITSGIQVNIQEIVGMFEKWHMKSYNRLLLLIQDKPVVLITGDVHTGEIIRYPCNGNIHYEVTSSGMSHNALSQYGYQAMIMSALFFPSTFSVVKKQYDYNFGIIDIDYENSRLSFKLISSDDNVLGQVDIQISELLDKIYDANCEYSYYALFFMHIACSFTLFILPCCLNLVSLIVILRKATNK